MKMILTIGVPASGKSTWSQQQDPSVYTVIERDELRLELCAELDITLAQHYAGKARKKREDMVSKMQVDAIARAVRSGKGVIISDTNLTYKSRNRLGSLARQFGLEVEYKLFHITPTEAAIRDAARPKDKQVGEAVMRRMSQNYHTQCKELILAYFKEELEAKWATNALEDDIPLIVCDLDGTIAHRTGRSPYDWHRVGEDVVDKPMLKQLEMWYTKARIVFVSGRDGQCADLTAEWLMNNVPFINMPTLFMRPYQDVRPDWLIKSEILLELGIKPLIMYDDRSQVVQAMRALGIKVFQVAEGNF